MLSILLLTKFDERLFGPGAGPFAASLSLFGWRVSCVDLALDLTLGLGNLNFLFKTLWKKTRTWTQVLKVSPPQTCIKPDYMITQYTLSFLLHYICNKLLIIDLCCLFGEKFFSLFLMIHLLLLPCTCFCWSSSHGRHLGLFWGCGVLYFYWLRKKKKTEFKHFSKQKYICVSRCDKLVVRNQAQK